MPRSIPKGLTREHVLRALADLDAGVQHPFGAPTGYDFTHEGKSYPPKAVVGLASRYLIGRILQPDEFSSGVGPGLAVSLLRKLGFTVVKISEDWTVAEVDRIIADYFDMLRPELLGLPYSKTEHRQRLASSLNERSDASIEFKHQNISAVLVNMGLPYIDGYKPRGNFQALLATRVEDYVSAHPELFDQLADAKRINPTQVPVLASARASLLFVPPPDRILVPKVTSQPWLSRRGMKIDFARRDAENRRLGSMGEKFVVELEQKRLREARRDDLSSKVEWIAQSCGDGIGYDVLSFNEENGLQKFIEVKTTGLGRFFPFYVSSNELRCSEAVPEKFELYRVFDFARTAKLYVLPGALSKVCQLDPVQYRASF